MSRVAVQCCSMERNGWDAKVQGPEEDGEEDGD